MLGVITRDVDWILEARATALLKRDRKIRGIKGVEALSEEYCWLTEEQMAARQDKEVYNVNGFPDPSIRSGVLWRAYNPLIGTRPKRPEAA